MHVVKRWLRSERATAAMEFALTVPVLLVFIGGVVEFGRAFQVYEATNRLATQYAIAFADCSDFPAGTCSTELSNYTAANAIANIAPQLQASKLTLQIFQVQMNGTTPAVTYPVGGTLTAVQTAAAVAALPSGQPGVIVTASYVHSLIYFQALIGPLIGAHLSPNYTVVQLKSGPTT